jgi:uncharacterized membrane protein YkoI
LELEMNEKLKGGLIAAAAVAVLAAGGAAIAGATGNDSSAPSAGQGSGVEVSEDGGARDDEAGRDDGNGEPVTGSPLDRASAVALQETGGGSVTGSEIDDEEGYYEIEVTKADGSQVDVHLDRDFNVIDASSDGGGED